MKILIIAEAGVNHNGDMDMSRKLIDAAAAAGADMVKFQTFSAERLVTMDARKADYQMSTSDTGESQYSMIKNLELTREMHKELISHCKLRGIQFFSSGFDPLSVDLLVELGIDNFKIPSGEITNLPYLRHIGSFGKPVFVSTGMATLGEIEAALDIIEKVGTPRDLITILHCSTEYPTSMADVNLHAMLSIREAFGTKVGYSDHTQGIEVAIAAAALGAVVIEKHFTLDQNLPGPDHKASLEPDMLKEMVIAIRNVEKALGNGIKWPSENEIKNRAAARKSLVAACDICAGEMFTESNLTVKRPGTGVSPMLWDEVIGHCAIRDFSVDELIEL